VLEYGSQTNKVDTDGGVYTGIIDVLHQAVHIKKMHTLSYTKLNVADGGTLKVAITAGANTDIHIRLAWVSEGKSRLITYSGSTFSGGTSKVPFNRIVGESSNMEGVILIDPTVTVNGTQRGNDFIGGGGATAQRFGGTGSSDIETVIKSSQTLLIEITNLRGSASDINIIGNMYERNKFV